MACNDCEDYNLNEEECAQDCGCDKHYDAACVRFNKKDLPCVGKPKGTDLEQIIEEIDSKLCGVSDGSDGLSAYEVAVSNGFEGTEEEWLESLNGEDGTDCDCEGDTVVLYQEELQLDNLLDDGSLGNWTSLADISTATSVSIPSFSYTVPAGVSGNYEVDLQGTVAYTFGSPGTTEQGMTAEVLIDGVPVAGSISAATVFDAKSPYTQLSLFKSNISLVAGQIISIGLSTSSSATTALINSKLQIKKLA